jgi:hypothetical protein
MRLSTYESGTIPGVFVTVPSTEAQFVIAMVDQLSALRLRPFRTDYTISEDAHFLELVTTRIADNGYAVHGFDIAVGRGNAADPPSSPLG